MVGQWDDSEVAESVKLKVAMKASSLLAALRAD